MAIVVPPDSSDWSDSSNSPRRPPPGAETAEIEGCQPFAWKHNALRHSFISYRVADIQNIPQVAMEGATVRR